LAISAFSILGDLTFQALDAFLMLLDSPGGTKQAFPPPIEGITLSLQPATKPLNPTLS
jgi:hypothetical protein